METAINLPQNPSLMDNDNNKYIRKTPFIKTDLGSTIALVSSAVSAGALFYIGYNYSDFSEPPFVVFPGAVALTAFGALSAVIDKIIRSKGLEQRQILYHGQTLEHEVAEPVEPMPEPLISQNMQNPNISSKESDKRRCYVEYD